jgi:putative transposase
LTSFDRVVLGIAALFVSARRIPQLAVILKPSTLFRLHRLLVDHKYRRLFSSSRSRRRPGPKGPAAELIAAIVEMKSRNPNFGHLRIAQQISHAFGVGLQVMVVIDVFTRRRIGFGVEGGSIDARYSDMLRRKSTTDSRGAGEL